ncbi:MerR family transcriptional regulator [Nocardioides gansuensis]|uniref:MerR family transcriptional regulator n=1 Tax=Nocardioides gansuensis TaxID=2138300 RepID=A0A2T8FCJ8_9ACTN|nr:MerR family transcriptional regulator [Nocardioides gansuensis]PVG83434.1 MerR family transcriptional regulator [Nocardioides gansuensis]
MKSSHWSVGEVAERFGLATHVLRHWEDMGLLTPERDSAGRRRYGRDDLVRVAAVQRNKAAGMSLEQIRLLFDGSADGRRRVLTDHLADIDERIRALETSRAMTEHALDCRAHDITTCPNFRKHLETALAGGPWHPGPGDHEHAHATPEVRRSRG